MSQIDRNEQIEFINKIRTELNPNRPAKIDFDTYSDNQLVAYKYALIKIQREKLYAAMQISQATAHKINQFNKYYS